jgi:hypothetical protein
MLTHLEGERHTKANESKLPPKDKPNNRTPYNSSHALDDGSQCDARETQHLGVQSIKSQVVDLIKYRLFAATKRLKVSRDGTRKKRV